MCVSGDGVCVVCVCCQVMERVLECVCVCVSGDGVCAGGVCVCVCVC